MTAFSPARIVGGTIVAERDPYSFDATASYRGVEIGWTTGASGAAFRDLPQRSIRRVVVREPHEFVSGEEHFLTLFERSVAELAALAGTPAPQLLYALGRNGRINAIVVEHLDGVPIDRILAALRARGELLPIRVALAIADELIGLWKAGEDCQQPVAFHLGIGDVLVSPSGQVRARPELASEQARQTVGAAAQIFAGNVAYISPEQIDGRFGAHSGMFTLGLLLYELLTCEYPWGARTQSSMFELLTNLRNQDLPLVTSKRDVPTALALFVARAGARDPDARFSSWDDLARSLAAVRSLFAPAGPTDILAALAALPPSVQPVAAPAVDPELLTGWEALPSDDLRPMAIPGRARAVTSSPSSSPLVDPDLVYWGADQRPMLAHGRLLVDARPVTVEEFERFALAIQPGLSPTTIRGGDPRTLVSFEQAADYAAWAGKRLPTEDEWVSAVAALGAARLGIGAVWEWTATKSRSDERPVGQVVRGGRWRDNWTVPASPEHRSFEQGPAADLGFRCVSDDHDQLGAKAARTNLWVSIEDQYDRDSYRMGPFPTDADAYLYCDAYNGAQLTVPSGGIPSTISKPTDVRVWNLATATGYEFEARALAMLRDPSIIPADPEAILRRVGARRDAEWMKERNRTLVPSACWCAALIADVQPEADRQVVAAYLAEALDRERSFGSTSQHHGDLNVFRCRLCRGPILHLMIEHEGLPDAIGHYYTPLTEEDLAAVVRVSPASEALEAWVGQRAGLYRQGFNAQIYRRVRVGYVGVDHQLEPWERD